mgnify:CR=1 FL=1
MIELIKQYVSLKKRGNYYFGLCPFHLEKKPSFSKLSLAIDSEKEMYKCFCCGESGNIISFIKKIKNKII